jgi:hypothetical protein
MQRLFIESGKASLCFVVAEIAYYSLGHALYVGPMNPGGVIESLTIGLFVVAPAKWLVFYVAWRLALARLGRRKTISWNAAVVAGLVAGAVALLVPPYALNAPFQLSNF